MRRPRLPHPTGPEVRRVAELTGKELGAIEECIKMEALFVRKLQYYERACSDPELRDICDSAMRTAERHIQDLLGLLR
jgi:hypothetical protein